MTDRRKSHRRCCGSRNQFAAPAPQIQWGSFTAADQKVSSLPLPNPYTIVYSGINSSQGITLASGGGSGAVIPATGAYKVIAVATVRIVAASGIKSFFMQLAINGTALGNSIAVYESDDNGTAIELVMTCQGIFNLTAGNVVSVQIIPASSNITLLEVRSSTLDVNQMVPSQPMSFFNFGCPR